MSEPLLLYTHPETGELFRRRWQIHVVEGSDRGRVVEVAESPALIGAAPASALVLTDDTVSRYHAEIDLFSEGLRLRDLDSTNGTFLANDQRIRQAFIQNGDTVRVGRTSLRIIALDETAASEIETDPHGGPRPGEIETVGGALAVAERSRELLRNIRKVALSQSPVLFVGEPGTGKSTYAKLLHRLSPRKKQPFVIFDATDRLPPPELEARLFGSAVDPAKARVGLFERAKGGTLFMRDVDAIAPPMQKRVLHAIETGEIERVASDRKRRIDIRLISSTSVDVAKSPKIEPALLRRLGVVKLRVPNLRERPEDIAPLADLFLRRIGNAELKLGRQSVELLKTQRWPKNVRQLEDVVTRVAKNPGGIGDDLPGEADFTALLRRALVSDVLARHRGSVTKTARALSVQQKALFIFLKRHQVDLDAM